MQPIHIYLIASKLYLKKWLVLRKLWKKREMLQFWQWKNHKKLNFVGIQTLLKHSSRFVYAHHRSNKGHSRAYRYWLTLFIWCKFIKKHLFFDSVIRIIDLFETHLLHKLKVQHNWIKKDQQNNNFF